MRIIIKKFIYLFMMIAIAVSSTQSLYASNQPECEHTTTINSTMDMDHCQQMKAGKKCNCQSDCGCKIHISYLSATTTIPVTFQYRFSLGEIVAELTDQYAYYYFNPLLRPPIH